MDIVFHYPPELMSLLIDTIPLLFRSKMDVLLFFKGAGVNDSRVHELSNHVRQDRTRITEYEICRTVLAHLNEKGEFTIRERREILKRVTEFEDFSTCWPNDQLKAKGLVAEIRRVVDVKDSFTRINQEREKEKKKHQADQQEKFALLQKKRSFIGG
jgi:restriction system protein